MGSFEKAKYVAVVMNQQKACLKNIEALFCCMAPTSGYIARESHLCIAST